MSILTHTIIGILVPLVQAILDCDKRLSYYFAVGIVLAGACLSFWGYTKKSISAAEYHHVSAQVLAFVPLSEVESVGVRTSAAEYYISSSYLSKDEREMILSTEWSPRPADIWLGTSDGTDIKGLETTGLKIDRYLSAAIDSEFYRRLVNVGFIISGFGIFLFTLHHFTPGTDSKVK